MVSKRLNTKINQTFYGNSHYSTVAYEINCGLACADVSGTFDFTELSTALRCNKWFPNLGVEALLANESKRQISSLAGKIALFPAAKRKNRDWDAQELAEFYRVESALVQSGMRIITDRGLSDEGDPWFVFCREMDGEIIIHFARIDGNYIIASPAYEGVARGQDFRSMVKEMIERHKLSLTAADKGKSNIHIHPAALLIVLVGAAFFKTPSDAKADEFKKSTSLGQTDISSQIEAVRANVIAKQSSLAGLAIEQTDGDQALLQTLWVIASTSILSNVSDDNHDILFSPQLIRDNAQELNIDAHAYPITTKSIDFASDNDVKIDRAFFDNNYFFSTSPPEFNSVNYPETTGIISNAVNADIISNTAQSAPINHQPITFLQSEIIPPFVFFKSDGSRQFTEIAPPPNTPSRNADTITHVDGNQQIVLQKVNLDKLLVQASPGIYEVAAIVDEIPAPLKNVIPIGVAPQFPGSAINYLSENNIIVTFKSEQQGPTSGGTGNPHPQEASAANVNNQALNNTNSNSGAVSGQSTDTHAPQNLSTSAFQTTLSTFLQEGHDVQLTISHGYYVFSDSSTGPKDSITMTFSDGSAISIIGQQQMLIDIISHLA
jgi:hypothetical protein